MGSCTPPVWVCRGATRKTSGGSAWAAEQGNASAQW